MRILNWVQNKIKGRTEKTTVETVIAGSSLDNHTSYDKQGDWPQALLSIGTLGNNDLNGESMRRDSAKFSSSSQKCSDFTAEEVNKLRNALTKLLSKPRSSLSGSKIPAEEKGDLPLDRFLNCPSSLEIDRRTCKKFCDDLDNGEAGDLSPETKMILSKAKEALAQSNKKFNTRSLTFLFKKMFVCGGGFPLGPTLRDPSESRIEKILTTILHKKICTQKPDRTSTTKYLELPPTSKNEIENERPQENAPDGSRWVKTDSEYIVLEI